MVQQIRNPARLEHEGFWSGPPTERGSFSFQFNNPGTYYYWSGYIEQSKVVSFQGVIVVLDIDEVKNLEIEVTQNQINALKCNFPFTYNSNTYSDCIEGDESFKWCSSSDNANSDNVRLNCHPISKFKFLYFILNYS